MSTVSSPNPLAELNQDQMLNLLRKHQWKLYPFGSHGHQDFYSAVYNWGGIRADVVHLRGRKYASAYRVVLYPGVDLFAPTLVEWQYHATTLWTLRAVLALSPPGKQVGPIETAHELCSVPKELRQPSRKTGPDHRPGWAWF